MHFIEDVDDSGHGRIDLHACIRQNVCTSLRTNPHPHGRRRHQACIRQNVCTSLRRYCAYGFACVTSACIRQNVCTSLRSRGMGPCGHRGRLHTSKRMHFIEDSRANRRLAAMPPCIRQNVCTSLRKASWPPDRAKTAACIRQNVCTSLRIFDQPSAGRQNRILAYVKTYALH